MAKIGSPPPRTVSPAEAAEKARRKARVESAEEVSSSAPLESGKRWQSRYELRNKKVETSAVVDSGGAKNSQSDLLALRKREDSHRQLQKLARAVAADPKLKLNAGEDWGYAHDTHAISYPAEAFESIDPKQRLGLIYQQLAFCMYSRMPNTEEIGNPAFSYLWGSTETLRINKMICGQYSGIAECMGEVYRNDVDLMLRKTMAKLQPKVQQFARAFNYMWVTGKDRDPAIRDKHVNQAITEAAPFIAEATALPEGVDIASQSLGEPEILAQAQRSYEVVRDKVWPIFQRLLEQDLEDRAAQPPPQNQDKGDSKAGGPKSPMNMPGLGGTGSGARDQKADGSGGESGGEKTGDPKDSTSAGGKQNAQGGGADQSGTADGTKGRPPGGNKPGGGDNTKQSRGVGDQDGSKADGADASGVADGSKADGAKTGGSKTGSPAGDSKTGDAKADGSKTGSSADDAKADGSNAGDAKAGDAKADRSKTGDAKADGSKADGSKIGSNADAAKTESKADGSKADSTKAGSNADAAKTESKADGSNAHGTNAGSETGTKADDAKVDGAKTGSKPDGSKADGTKAGSKKTSSKADAQDASKLADGRKDATKRVTQPGSSGAGAADPDTATPKDDTASGLADAKKADNKKSSGLGDAADDTGPKASPGADSTKASGPNSGNAAELPGGPPKRVDPKNLPSDPLDVESTPDSLKAAATALSELLAAATADSAATQIDLEQAYQPKDSVSSQSGPTNTTKQIHADRALSADELIAAAEAELNAGVRQELALRSPYQSIKSSVQKEIDDMVDRLGNIFMRTAIPQWGDEHFKSGGRYDMRRAQQSRLRKAATGKRETNLYLRREDPTARRQAIVLAVDISESMQDKIYAVKQAVVIFQEALSELGIDFGVVLFNKDVNVVKDLATPTDETDREAVLPLLVPQFGTWDWGASKTAKQMLLDNDADQRLIVFLTDGAGTDGQDEFIKRLEYDHDIKSVGVGIAKEGCEAVKSTYKHHVLVEDVQQLTGRFSDLLVEELLE